jgi:hypothetical protein
VQLLGQRGVGTFSVRRRAARRRFQLGSEMNSEVLGIDRPPVRIRRHLCRRGCDHARQQRGSYDDVPRETHRFRASERK